MNVVALAGGVGGAKLAAGLSEVVAQNELTVVVNTGDDFDWMGLRICPDLDTVVYALAGLNNPQTGWGVQNDTFHVLDSLRSMGCDTWFRVGDRDLATHLFRTRELQAGISLSEITRAICRMIGIGIKVLPMTDSSVPTIIDTDEGTMPFQDYFVRRKCEPRTRGFTFHGIENATPAPGVLSALECANAIIVCPSNPFVSTGPILAVPGLKPALGASKATVAAVSPIIAGRAVKGPTARMLEDAGVAVCATSVAGLYRDFVDIFVVDVADEMLRPQIESMGLGSRALPILMDTPQSRAALARKLLDTII